MTKNSSKKKIGPREIPDTHEWRGFVVRIYPTVEQEIKLSLVQEDCFHVWNWLCGQRQVIKDARNAYCKRHQLVEEIEKPDYSGLNPDEAHQAKIDFHKKCAARAKKVFDITENISGLSWRNLEDTIIHFDCKYDYQLFNKVLDWKYENVLEPRSIRAQSLVLVAVNKNFRSTKGRKNFKKKIEDMPIQVKSGDCFELGDFGTRRGVSFYNCQIKFNGLKIKGRLPGKLPSSDILEGVTITKQADGWYAAIRESVPKRILAPAEPNSSVGIDMGLDLIIATSDGKTVENPRGKYFSNLISDRQKKDLPVGRLQQQAARQVKHLIFNEIIKPLNNVETIVLEELSAKIGQLGSSKVSVIRLVNSLLKERFGLRVREVDPAYTSQDCSQCGKRSKETWSYDHGPIGECPYCGFKENRDINAARNVLRKYQESLISSKRD